MAATTVTSLSFDRASLEGDDAALGAILAVMRERTGTDFCRYRPSTIRRRVLNRMISIGADTFERYLGVVLAREDEALQLLERLTIKVSRFYRNAVTFDLLRNEVLPQLAAELPDRPLRLWSAGCGYGEEAFTLALLLADAGLSGVVEASDVDPAALHRAKAAVYPAASLSEVPQDLRTRYFVPSGDEAWTVTDDVRALVRFSRHDLLSASPVPCDSAAFDVVCCRNVLIYFDRRAQLQALHRLRQAVRGGGYLCLGEAEWPMPPVSGWSALDHKAKVFRAAAGVSGPAPPRQPATA
jgi:chemotaxis methyl-accepting protein methylase